MLKKLFGRKAAPSAAARGAAVGAALLAAVAAPASHASALDISLGDESANFELLMRSTELGIGGQDAGAGLFFNEGDDFVAHVRWMGIGGRPSPTSPLTYTVGIKGYFGELDAADVSLSGIAVGGGIALLRPSASMPISFGVEGFYAPNITSFGDAENILEVGLRLSIDVLPTTRAYLGYRMLEADFDTADSVELDDAIHFGVRLNFD